MVSVWKYELIITDTQAIKIPEGAVLLSVQLQNGALCLWARVQTDAPKTLREIHIHGTGHPLHDDEGAFIGTFQIRGGELIFHVFDGGER